ncbi:hypothetical protein LTR37_019576 [Vermiconidia calcicola]|uniref:Uncharacterized protein n=1 Tax=Vermiconidia calcicola TaxID=1690605 RepID=A0ACC3MDU6_9PEZI|nr:hypothetical protein LTR37_019576 [Vermiconidia calcicola]
MVSDGEEEYIARTKVSIASNKRARTLKMVANGETILRPSELCHVVLKTTPENFPKMVEFYLTFLGGTVVHGNHRIKFVTFDHKDHRLAIIAIPGLKHPDPPQSSVGLAHISFGFKNLQELATSYEQKKANGLLPYWCVNHGMTTSMYYHDPDGNGAETQVDNFDTDEESMEYIQSENFAENPIGVDYDPEEFVKRLRSGEDEKEIKKRPNIGTRMIPAPSRLRAEQSS